LYTYLDKYKILSLSLNQFGFKEISSTSDAIQELFNEMAENTKKQSVQCF